VSIRRQASLLLDFASDESANALSDYAIVLSALSIIAIVAFNAFGATSSTVVTSRQTNFSNSASMSYQH
jgi:hypothetical protein